MAEEVWQQELAVSGAAGVTESAGYRSHRPCFFQGFVSFFRPGNKALGQKWRPRYKPIKTVDPHLPARPLLLMVC